MFFVRQKDIDGFIDECIENGTALIKTDGNIEFNGEQGLKAFELTRKKEKIDFFLYALKCALLAVLIISIMWLVFNWSKGISSTQTTELNQVIEELESRK